MTNELTIEEMQKRLRWYEKRYGPYIEKRGIHNMGNLFRKPTMHDYLTLFMLLMAIFIAYAYKHDTAECTQTLQNIKFTACQICGANIILNNSAGCDVQRDYYARQQDSLIKLFNASK